MRSIRIQGMFEPHIVEVLKKKVASDAICLDIGANIGSISVTLSLLAPGGRIFAFEPVAENYEFLRKNLEANGIRNVEPFRLALSDQNGRAQFNFTSEFAGGAHFSDTSWVDSREKSESVEMRTLDSWVKEKKIEQIDVIKLDVEGAELRVLRGAEETLKRFRPVLIVEFNGFTLEKIAGIQCRQFFEELQARFDRLSLVRRETGQLVELNSFEEMDGYLREDQVQDLVCEYGWRSGVLELLRRWIH